MARVFGCGGSPRSLRRKPRDAGIAAEKLTPSRRLLIGGHAWWAGRRKEEVPPAPRDALKRRWWRLRLAPQLTSAMSSAAGPDPSEAPEERRFLRSGSVSHALEQWNQRAPPVHLLPPEGARASGFGSHTAVRQASVQPACRPGKLRASPAQGCRCYSGVRWEGGFGTGFRSLVEHFWLHLRLRLSVSLSVPSHSVPSTAEAAALERELLEDYRFGRQQLVELCGHASAVAVTKAFPLPALSRKQRTVLVVCGPEQNGAVGLVCARHLRVFEYEPTIFYPTRSLDLLHRDLTTQCEKMDIPFLSYLPTEVQLINEAYGLVVDAVMGPGVEPREVGGPCTRALATLKLLSIPLVSLDIPSGWDAETGSDSEDGLRPDVLVSLAAPKRCAGRFSGRHHFVAGRFVPDDVLRKFALRLPGYTGTDCVAAL
ncbi:yjeF N-terminal domain-containing protein 3 [Aotus nancymaae]|uniref:yjeF N-terminal domain-containing protein 3 n=1 Tax=Aotus nancymaae TaxID=37293 RepID=UPI0030FE47D5